MLEIFSKQGEKVVKITPLQATRKKGIWIDALSPNVEELKQISKLIKVPYNELREHLHRYERPSTYEFEKYNLVVIGTPVPDKKILRTSISFFFDKNNMLTLRMIDNGALDLLKKELQEKDPSYLTNHLKLLRRLFERSVDEYFEQQDLFQDRADAIEIAIIHKSNEEHVLQDIFKLKKQLLHTHKVLIANREVVLSVEKGRMGKISRQEQYDVRDVYNDVVQLIDANDTLRDVVTGIIDMHLSSVSNKMNNAMKKLTVMASYVLIPTLIASIYGMNFKFMPEVYWKWGYPFSIGLMILSILALYIYFKKAKWE